MQYLGGNGLLYSLNKFGSKLYMLEYGLRTPIESFFSTVGLGQTNWTEILGGIWAIYGQTISTILAL